MARWFVDRSPQRGIPSISLRRLLPDARFVGCHDLHVSGCSADSRRLDPGQVFVAVRGRRHDGHQFVGRALDRGAAAVVVERPCDEAGPIQVVVPDSRRALARLCQALAGEPAERLRVVGVTGRTGRTATALFLRSIFEAAGRRFGVVGASGWTDGVNDHPPGASGPGPAELAEILAAMVGRGCDGGAVEVEARDLERRAVEGIAFDAAVATDVAGPSPEPADAIRRRRRAQARLFRLVRPGGTSVVNADDPDADLLGAVNLRTRRVAFALRGPADVSARIDRLDASGTRLRLLGFDREAAVRLRPLGTGHVRSALAAAAVAWSRDLATDAVVDGLEAVARIPGRLEPIAAGQPCDAWVERSRSEAELRAALAALREVCSGPIHCILSADDGPTPRIDLSRAAEEGSDRLVLTLDDPTASGDPDALIDGVLAALRRPGRARVEPDRGRAIEQALTLARPGEGLLIAGRGVHTLPIRPDRDGPATERAIVARWLRRTRADRRRSA